mgnify:CR=1 FL=1
MFGWITDKIIEGFLKRKVKELTSHIPELKDKVLEYLKDFKDEVIKKAKDKLKEIVSDIIEKVKTKYDL